MPSYEGCNTVWTGALEECALRESLLFRGAEGKVMSTGELEFCAFTVNEPPVWSSVELTREIADLMKLERLTSVLVLQGGLKEE